MQEVYRDGNMGGGWVNIGLGFHYQGQFCIAKMEDGQPKAVYIDGIELNLLPEMLPEIMKTYRKIKAGMN